MIKDESGWEEEEDNIYIKPKRQRNKRGWWWYISPLTRKRQDYVCYEAAICVFFFFFLFTLHISPAHHPLPRKSFKYNSLRSRISILSPLTRFDPIPRTEDVERFMCAKSSSVKCMERFNDLDLQFMIFLSFIHSLTFYIYIYVFFYFFLDRIAGIHSHTPRVGHEIRSFSSHCIV